MLTDKEYVKSKGQVCPFCGSNAIEGDDFDCDEGWAAQKMKCNDCGRRWFDEYQLIGFTLED